MDYFAFNKENISEGKYSEIFKIILDDNLKTTTNSIYIPTTRSSIILSPKQCEINCLTAALSFPS